MSIEPTSAEKRNGWTAQALGEYIQQRERAALIRVFGDPGAKKRRPLRVMNVRKFQPHRWGRKKNDRAFL